MLPETVVAVLAVSRLGAILTPIFSGYAAPAIATRLADAGARLLITADGFLRRGAWVDLKSVADAAVAAAPTVERVLVVRRAGEALDVPWDDARDVWWADPDDDDGPATDRVESADRDPETPYMIIYTSGTTGAPKGAVHVHGGFPIKAAQDLAHTFDLTAADTLFWFTDLGWMMGPVGHRRLAPARRPARPVRRGAGLSRARPAVVAGGPAPRHPSRAVADRHPGADGPRRGPGPIARPLVAARPRLDRRAVEPGTVVVVLPRGRRGALSGHQLQRRHGGVGRHRRRHRGRTDQAGVVLRSVHRDRRGRRRRGRETRSVAASASSSSGRPCRG